jgi:phage FluMu protein Com
MPTVIQMKIRCAACNRRLADLVNEVEAGQVLVELKCPRCGQPHLEVIRPQPTDTPPKARATGRVGMALGPIFSMVSSLPVLAVLSSLALMVATSVSPGPASGASTEPLTDVHAKGRICDPMVPTLGRTIDERWPTGEAPERGTTIHALLGTETRGEAATVGETESQTEGVAFCSGHDRTEGEFNAQTILAESAHGSRNR